MIVMCEGCETSFQVDDRLIKPTGSKVRCSKCRHVFVAYAPAAVAVPEEPLILSDELPATSSNGTSTDLPDIGHELDALFANDAAAEADTSADQEPELLDVEDLLVEDALPASALAAESPEDDLKLDLDLDLNFDEDTAAKDSSAELSAGSASHDVLEADYGHDLTPAQEAASGDDDALASLDELGIKLDNLEPLGDETMPAASASAEPSEADTSEQELDLNTLMTENTEDLPLESAAAVTEEALPGGAAVFPEESVAAESAAAAPSANETELDLSDLEAMLEGSLADTETKSSADDDLQLDLDTGGPAVIEGEKAGDMEELDLTAITGETVAAEDPSGIAGTLASEIDFALDLEEGPEPIPAAAESAEPGDDELDFSDITNILEEPPIEPDKAPEEAPLELDLFSDDDSTPAEPPEAPPAEAPEGLLLDLESLLEDEEGAEAPVEQKPVQSAEELDLDFAVGSAPAMTDDLEIEIESIPVEAEKDVSEEAVAEVAQLAETPAAATDALAAEKVTDTGIDGATDVLDMGSAAAAAMAAEAEQPSGLRKYLLVAAGVLVLAVAAILIPRSLGINIPLLSDLEIPFLGKVFQSEPEDVAGNLKMAPVAENLTAEFINHPGAGRLCVIKGQVRNNYDHPRSAIRVTAKLYTKDKTLAKTATVFAGNVLSSQELSAQDMAAIAARLKNKEGVNHANVGVQPGRTVPFMAVFDNLPDNLDEYSVEVAGSTK
jgi:pilus assembly protein FimV